jgi:hypothetical protein
MNAFVLLGDHANTSDVDNAIPKTHRGHAKDGDGNKQDEAEASVDKGHVGARGGSRVAGLRSTRRASPGGLLSLCVTIQITHRNHDKARMHPGTQPRKSRSRENVTPLLTTMYTQRRGNIYTTISLSPMS